MTQIIQIPVASIVASPTARPVKEGKVLELMGSIEQIGLRQPINVRPLGDGYERRGGGHRLEACKRLGWSHVPCISVVDDDLHAELAEIDENLIRNELSPAERALAVSRRKSIYEALHPETAAGGDRKSSRQVGDLIDAKPERAERFTKATANATGQSERAIQRDAARGEALGADTLSKVAGTSLDAGEQIDALAKLSEPKRAELIERAAKGEDVNAKAAVKAEKRETKERDLAQKTQALPAEKFNVIYADPPWRFEVYSRETGMDRAADNHYPTVDTQGICDMKVADIAAADCVLFLWATVPMLPEALQVMAAWGFKYKSHQVWNKDALGTGYWFRNKHELLLVGTNGEIPAPIAGTQMASVIDAPVRDHSRKPVIFRAMIETLFPNLPKIELFARTPAPGWHQWGKEAPEALPAEDENDDTTTKAERRDASLMRAYMDDDNDGVRNAPEGGISVLPEGDGDGLDIPEFLRRKAS